MKTLDYIALIVTCTVSLILLFIVVSPAITGNTLSDSKAQLVHNLISSYMTLAAMYVGAKLKSKIDK